MIEGENNYEKDLYYRMCQDISKYFSKKLLDKNVNCVAYICLYCNDRYDYNINDCNNIKRWIDGLELGDLSDKTMYRKNKDHGNLYSGIEIRKAKPTELPYVRTSISIEMIGFPDFNNSSIESRVKQVINKLSEKLYEKEQLQLNKPNILVIDVNEPYMSKTRIKKVVKQLLCDNKNKTQALSGVWIRNIGDGLEVVDIHIPNQYASNESKLDKSELDEIGIKAT